MNISNDMFKHISSQKTYVQVLWVLLLSWDDDVWLNENVMEDNREAILAHYKQLNASYTPDWESLTEAYQNGIEWHKKLQQANNMKLRAEAIHVLLKLNETAGTSFAMTGRKAETNIRLVTARFSEGYTKQELFSLIAHKVKEWKGTKMERYIRPSTLFKKSKIDGYINEISIVKNDAGTNSKSRIGNIADIATAAKQYH